MFKKTLFLTGAASLLSHAALAADLPSSKEIAPPAPVATVSSTPSSWTGFYAGVNAGGLFDSGRVNVGTAPSMAAFSFGSPIFAPALSPIFFPSAAWSNSLAAAVGATGFNGQSANAGGFIGGGQIGYNWAFDHFLVGVETDIQGVAGATESRASVAGAPVVFPLYALVGYNGVSQNQGSNTLFWKTNYCGINCANGAPGNLIGATSTTRSVDYLGTVRGRIGYLVTPTLLAYATGGLAYGGVTLNTSVFQALSNVAATGFGADSFSDTRVGWSTGGGFEWMIAPRWSIKGEYLYYDLGAVNRSFALSSNGSPYAIAQSSTRFDGHIVRAGVNYHFNWGLLTSGFFRF